MEDLEIQQKIIELGKTIVKELKLDPGVDTLSKWMAHYIAEKIELSEKLTGKEKTDLQNECFEIILKLWENRWSVPPIRNYLEDFQPVLETLERLNPKRKTPFFYDRKIQFVLNLENEKNKSKEIECHLNKILEIDRLARSIISDLFKLVVSKMNFRKDRVGEVIRDAINLIDYPDMRIIKIISDSGGTLNIDGDDKKREQINEIQEKIKDLNELSSLTDSLIEVYRKKIDELQK